MHIAPDGSPVELYRRLSVRADDAALIHENLPDGATVLDLGCGTGRIAEPLADLGHSVTGVDNEPQMLAALRLATPVCADITMLDLHTSFDAVLLMSHLVNNADGGLVEAILRTVRRHLRNNGVAVIERYPPGWANTCTAYSQEADGVRYTMHSLARVDSALTATLRYEFDALSCEQRFSVRNVDDSRLMQLASAAGLRTGQPLNSNATLVLLRHQAADQLA